MDREGAGRLSAAGELADVPLRAFPLLRALRPEQWPKNLLVFAALAFSAGDAWRPGDVDTWWPLLWRSGALFVAWCMVASSTYLVNDLRDREQDRLHPRKRLRAIASGQLGTTPALVAAAVLAVAGIALALGLDWRAGAFLAGYAAVMVAYSGGLKQVAVLDVLILAGGFLVRAVSGGLAIDVEISAWLYVCTGAAAFFLASSKRWAEFRELGEDAAKHRPALAHYTREILDQMMVVSAAAALLGYALYTIEAPNVPSSGAMALTLPFVVFAIFRYILLIGGKRSHDAPDQILVTDPQIIVAVVGWLLVAMTVLVVDKT